MRLLIQIKSDQKFTVKFHSVSFMPGGARSAIGCYFLLWDQINHKAERSVTVCSLHFLDATKSKSKRQGDVIQNNW
jgi:hypothetical protein